MRPWSFAHEGHGQDVVLLMVDFLPAVWVLFLLSLSRLSWLRSTRLCKFTNA
jgi:phage gp37-like protein